MAKQEIIQKPIVKVIDDFDGAELPDEHQAGRAIEFNGRTFDLYLSAASRKSVDTFIADLIDGAEETGPRRGDQIKSPHTIHDLRKWAKEKGYEVSPNRRAPNKVIRAFNDAH